MWTSGPRVATSTATTGITSAGMNSRLPNRCAKPARSSGLVVARTLVLELGRVVTAVGSAGPVAEPTPAPGTLATRVRLVVPVNPSPASATITRTAMPSAQAGIAPDTTKVPAKKESPRMPQNAALPRRLACVRSVTMKTDTAMKNAPMSQ
jgi:hypothetical protein